MEHDKKEKAWLDQYEKRLRERGLSAKLAISIRNVVTDIDLEDDPEMCADDEMSYMAQDSVIR